MLSVTIQIIIGLATCRSLDARGVLCIAPTKGQNTTNNFIKYIYTIHLFIYTSVLPYNNKSICLHISTCTRREIISPFSLHHYNIIFSSIKVYHKTVIQAGAFFLTYDQRNVSRFAPSIDDFNYVYHNKTTPIAVSFSMEIANVKLR